MEDYIKNIVDFPDPSASFWHAVTNIFFFFECYHFMTHSNVLFRIRLLPRKDLVRQRYYFLIDTTCVFIVNFVLLKRMRLIACFQIAQHMYYWLTWDKSSLAKKIISWSSLEWQRLPRKVSFTIGTFEILGTMFDWLVHLSNSYMLASLLSTQEVIMGVALVHVFVQMLLYNPRFAWSQPTSTPEWVEKRLNPLSSDDIPLTPGDKLFFQKDVKFYLDEKSNEKTQ